MSPLWIPTEVVYLQCYLVATRLVPSETAAVLVHVLCTPYTLFEATCIGCMRDLVRATAVTRGWNGYRNKSHHRKLTMGKQMCPPLLPGLEPETFRSGVRRSKHWAIPFVHLVSRTEQHGLKTKNKRVGLEPFLLLFVKSSVSFYWRNPLLTLHQTT